MTRYYNDEPIKAIIELYKTTAVFKTKGCSMGNHGLRTPKPGKKEKIKEWTPRSQRKCELSFEMIQDVMETEICLTYPLDHVPNLDGKLIHKQLNSFLQSLRYRFGKELLYGCVKEYTQKGAPHFHIMINQTWTEDLSKWFYKRWYSIVGTENPWHLIHGAHSATIRNQGEFAHYMVSYLDKEKQKAVPEQFKDDTGRFWSCSRSAPKPQKIEIGFTRQRENLSGEYACLRLARQFRRYYKAKIRNLNVKRKLEGKKLLKIRSKTGFTVRCGKKAFEQLLEHLVPF